MMNNKFKNIINKAIKAILPSFFFLFSHNVLAQTSIKSPSSYIVYDFLENKILDGKNMKSIRPIASITKIMTANVFIENNPNYKKNCATQILAEDRDTLKGTTTKLPRKTMISCSELLKAMMVHSDNYAAHALARMTHLSKQEFIDAMNRKARQLGMLNTHFEDSSGLSPQNYSTVLDLVKLSKYSMNKPELVYLSNLPSVKVKTGNTHIQMRNTNKLVRENIKSAVLSKTGFTNEAGYNLVFVNKCYGKDIAVISLNNANSQTRSQFTQNKLNYYCNH